MGYEYTAGHAQIPTVMDDDARWQAVLARDRRCDGRFVFAVRSTGIYCRPSCPARRPRRAQVRFFAGQEDAERAGFRPCRRCQPRDAAAPEAEVVRQVCRYIEDHPYGPVTLTALGAHVGVSPSTSSACSRASWASRRATTWRPVGWIASRISSGRGTP